MAQDKPLSLSVAQALENALHLSGIGEILDPNELAQCATSVDALFVMVFDVLQLDDQQRALIKLANDEGVPVYFVKPSQLKSTVQISTFKHIGLPFSVNELRQLFIDETNQQKENTALTQLVEFESMHLMVVEDNPINQQLLLELLEKAGHIVDIFDHAQHALSALKNNKYDILLVDYHLPDLTGIEFIKTCRDNGIVTKAVIMTADVSTELRDLCGQNEIDHLITKPFKLNELMAVINNS